NKFTGWVDMVFYTVAKKVRVFFVFSFYPRNKDTDDVLADLIQHRFFLIKIIMLVDITIASIRTGWLLSSYSSVTCDFASGRKYLMSVFSRRIAASSISNACAISNASGI